MPIGTLTSVWKQAQLEQEEARQRPAPALHLLADQNNNQCVEDLEREEVVSLLIMRVPLFQLKYMYTVQLSLLESSIAWKQVKIDPD